MGGGKSAAMVRVEQRRARRRGGRIVGSRGMRRTGWGMNVGVVGRAFCDVELRRIKKR